MLVTHNDRFYDELNSLNINVSITRLSNDTTIVFFDRLNEENIAKVINLSSVNLVESVVEMASLGEVTLGTRNGIIAQEEIGVSFFKNNPNVTLTGRGTLIAVIDSGIDYLHKDFIYADGTIK